jgi:type II secretory pathway pseudopilin PulG
LGLDPSQGYDTAAAGAKQAQQQANALSQLQWQRQMAGLQGALGYVGNLQSLYNSLYGPGGGQTAPGGGNVIGPPPTASQLSALAGPPPARKF